jgi:hypothetical protein
VRQEAREVPIRPRNPGSSGRPRRRARALQLIGRPGRRQRGELKQPGGRQRCRLQPMRDVMLQRKHRQPGRRQRRQLQLVTEIPRSIATETLQ